MEDLLDELLSSPYVWIAILAFALIVAYAIILLIAFALEQFGAVCDKFNKWVDDEISEWYFLIIWLPILPIYILSSLFLYLSKLCENFNNRMNKKTCYDEGKWTSANYRIFSVLFAIIGLIVFNVIFAIILCAIMKD